MPLRIDRVDTEIEILRKDAGGEASAADASTSSNDGFIMPATARERAALREKLRPFVLEILNDELMRIKRKVGSP